LRRHSPAGTGARRARETAARENRKSKKKKHTLNLPHQHSKRAKARDNPPAITTTTARRPFAHNRSRSADGLATLEQADTIPAAWVAPADPQPSSGHHRSASWAPGEVSAATVVIPPLPRRFKCGKGGGGGCGGAVTARFRGGWASLPSPREEEGGSEAVASSTLSVATLGRALPSMPLAAGAEEPVAGSGGGLSPASTTTSPGESAGGSGGSAHPAARRRPRRPPPPPPCGAVAAASGEGVAGVVGNNNPFGPGRACW